MEPRSHQLENLLTHEVAELVPHSCHRVLIPCGALEAHGAAGLGTDTIIPAGLADAIAPRLHALIAPPVPYGKLKTLANYPGSVSLSEETYTQLLYEIGDGLLRTGFKELIFLNGHSGNLGPIKNAMFRLHRERNARCLAYDWYREADDISADLYDGPGGHSGCGETAMVLAFRPEAAPSDSWRKDDAGTLNPATYAFPGPYPIILMEEGAGLPDYDAAKADRFMALVVEKAVQSIEAILDRWQHVP